MGIGGKAYGSQKKTLINESTATKLAYAEKASFSLLV